jgi:hypothetical protein
MSRFLILLTNNTRTVRAVIITQLQRPQSVGHASTDSCIRMRSVQSPVSQGVHTTTPGLLLVVLEGSMV